VAGGAGRPPAAGAGLEGLMAWVEGRYAVRSVGRNLRRTALSVLGIAIGCVVALYAESMNRGRDELFARMGAFGGTGHVRVVPAAWRDRHDVRLRLADWRTDAAAAAALPGVGAATPRARAEVLLAMGTRVVPLELVGVDPDLEPRTNRFVRTMQAGRYLRAGEPGTIVVGQVVADRLRAEVDDEIMATLVGPKGDIESAMFRIVGIVRTGSEEIDAATAQVLLDDVARLSGRPGAGEVTLILDDWRQTTAIRDALAPHLAAGDVALTWSEILPEFQGHMEQDKASARFISLIILLIVVLGVASAQLAAVLERRREFAVLSALGMGGGALLRLVMQEALALGLGGGLLGLLLGLPILWRLSTAGLDLRAFTGENWTFQGVLIEPILYGDLGPWVLPYVFAVAIGSTVVASLYPAWFAARTDPATALRVAQ